MKKIKCLLFAMILLTSTIAFNVIQTAKADSTNLLWEQFYGGPNDDYGLFFDKTTEGGWIITGRTDSYGVGGGDLYLIKTDSEGNKLWTKTFGGNGLDLGNEVRQTSDGGYIVAGRTSSFGSGYFDIYLIKVDSDGNLKWSKTYGGPNYDSCKSVILTTDGGYALLCDSASRILLLKTDSNGNELWKQFYGGSNNNGAECVQQTLDEGYIIVGSTNSAGAGDYDILLIKTDNQGNQQWSKTFGESSKDAGRSVKQTSDGGYIVAGDISGDYALIRTDAGGNAIWLRKYGGAGIDEAEHVSITSDGGFIVTGISGSFGAGGFDSWSLKMDGGGNPQWDATFGGPGYDLGTCIEETSQGYVILGSTTSYGSGGFDAFLISINTGEDKTPPLVFIQLPEDYEIYTADSELKYNFWATDDTSQSPSIVASVTDFTGEASPVSSGDPLPTSSGVYVLTVTATDLAGNIGVKRVTFVVYDPTAGFVTGGGWIYSPKGSYMLDLSLEGKANFGFVSKYNKGASVPTGNTEFVFQVANMNFHSTSYQ